MGLSKRQSHLKGTKRETHSVGIDADLSGFKQSSKTGWEWINMRKQCHDMKMDQCYHRYVDRLIVTNLSVFLFIMELLLAIHMFVLIVFYKKPLLISLPFLALMISLPFIRSICFKKHIKIQRLRLRMIIASSVAALSVTLMDAFFIPSEPDGFSYDHIIIVSIYFLLPISFYGKPYLLGIVVSIIYFLYYIISTCISFKKLKFAVHGGYGLYLITLNVIMVGFRLYMEYHLRHMILNRRELMHQNCVFKSTLQKEKDTINKVIPIAVAQSLKPDIHKRISDQILGSRLLNPVILHIDLHSDVTILIAKMVNYAHFTTHLNVIDLVEILHELFLDFEEAVKKHRALPIKFLGDSFSCVSGMPQYISKHAKSCVALACDMILKTRNLSDARDLDIEMRIGVHSGEVFAAFVGRSKWEYDIWSPDVDITYRLECLGNPGQVHISQTTLSFLNNEYDIEPGTELAKDDIQLQKADITTYLITPKALPLSNAGFKSRFSIISTHAYAEKELENIHVDELKIYHGMRDKVQHMPIGEIQMARLFMVTDDVESGKEDRIFQSHISTVFRLFCQSRIEWKFINQPDIFMKYSLLMMVFVSIMIFIENLLPPTSPHLLAMFGIIVFQILFCLLGFYKKIVLHLRKQPKAYNPKHFLHWWLFKLSEFYETKFAMRLFIYCLSIFQVYIIATINRAAIIAQETHISQVDERFLQFWEATDNVIMVFIIIFLSGLPLIFKVGLTTLVSSLHILTVHSFYHGWHFSSIWYLIAFCIMLLFKDLHITYIRKVDYLYTFRILEMHSKTENSKRNMKILMGNLLPSHVAPMFLHPQHNEELFHESYNNVAIMFASIVNFERDKTGLRVLNEYISYFDDLLMDFVNNYKVEKIKVWDWTYMAACGLKVDDKQPTMDSSKHARFQHPLLEQDDGCLITMVNFAVHMLRIIHDIELQNQYLPFGGSMRGQLMIGISLGPIVAGVVGSNRPHYDIWGQTVNLASYLCSTGVAGSIQVDDKTAQILRRLDIECSYRDTTDDQDLGTIISYLVELDERLSFRRVEEVELDIIEFADSADERPQMDAADQVVYLNKSDEDKNYDIENNDDENA